MKSITIPSKTTLSSLDELQIGATYQQLHAQTGFIPTPQAVYEFLDAIYPLEAIEDYSSSNEFQRKLMAWGLISSGPVGNALTPEQVMIANMELNLFDKRGVREKLKELETAGIKITLTQYEAWRRLPAFKAYLQERAKQLYENIDVDIQTGLVKAVQRGDLKAMEMVLTMQGKYSKTLNMNLNVESVLVRVVDIIARHVHDQPTLEAIATEIEALNA